MTISPEGNAREIGLTQVWLIHNSILYSGEELIARVINAEKVINEMKEMKTMTREIHDKCTSFSNRLDQLEERVSAIEDQMNEMKQEEKPKKKEEKEMNKACKKCGIM